MTSAKVEVPDSDVITPVDIKHNVEEIISDGQLLQCYNYLVYEFERDEAYCEAWAYLDGIETVSLHGPFADRDHLREVEAPDFYADVLSYLKRRFAIIDAPGDVEYVTIWRRPGFDGQAG